jgi:hypothetical protein
MNCQFAFKCFILCVHALQIRICNVNFDVHIFAKIKVSDFRGAGGDENLGINFLLPKAFFNK